MAEAPTAAPRSPFFAKLEIPTRPDYDVDTDSGGADYVPPVVLNNRIVLYTNAAIELTERIVRLNRKVEGLRLEQRKVSRKRDTLRTTLLAEHPAPPSAAKNLMLTEAYVLTLAKNAGLSGALSEYEDAIAAFEDQIDLAKSDTESAKYTMNTIKLACESIQTHLSFVKQEQKLHGRAPGA